MTKIKPTGSATAASRKPGRMARAPQIPVAAEDAVPEPQASQSELLADSVPGVLAEASTGMAEPEQLNNDKAGDAPAGTLEVASEADVASTTDAELTRAESTTADTQNEAGDSGSAQPAAKRQTKQDLVLSLLRQEGGVDLAGIVAATGWLPHTARAALTGLKKKGHAVQSTKVDKHTRYSLA